PVSASDLLSGINGRSSCSPLSGSQFPIGSTAVTCAVTDRANNGATASFMIVVQDTPPPSISHLPNALVVEAATSDGSPVTYPAPIAADASGSALPVDCAPLSGTTFPLGQTFVTCNAADANGK